MFKKITALLLICVIMMASVPVNVFSMIPNGAKAEENRDVPEVLEDIYYSDLFYGYDVSYLKSTEVMTYAKDTHDITTEVLIDYGNSPACILTGGYTALSSSPKDVAGLLFEVLLNTDYTYEKALDAANVKLLEQIAEKDTSDKFGTAQNITKRVRLLADMVKEYRDGKYPNDHFKDMSDGEKFEELMRDIGKNDLIIKLNNTKLNQIIATVATDIEKYIDFISVNADAIDLMAVTCTAIIMESARLELVDCMLEAAPYGSVLYDGMVRLRKQLDDGYVNFLLTHYFSGAVIDKLAELALDKALDSAASLGYIIAQIFSEVVLGMMLDVPSLHEVMLQSVLTSYSNDMYKILFDSEQGMYTRVFNRNFEIDDIAEFEYIFNAYTAATQASLEATQKLTLSSNSDRFEECLDNWYDFNYEKYMLAIVDHIDNIPYENRVYKYFDSWTVTALTGILPASDELVNGNIYMCMGDFRGNVEIADCVHIYANDKAVIDGNVTVLREGELIVDGELEITGDILLNSYSDYVRLSYGKLTMTEDDSVLSIGGDFTAGYPEYCCNLTAGTVVFNGSEQQTVIGLEAYNVEVTNPKGIKYGSDLYLHGNYQLNGKPLETNGCYTYWQEGATFSEGSYYSNVYIPSGISVTLDYPLMADIKNYGTLEISDDIFAELRGNIDNYKMLILYSDSDVKVDGNVTSYENSVIEIPANSKAKIGGNVTISYSGELKINGELEITGDLELKFASSYVSKSYGRLTMTEDDSVLTIGGDFIAGNSSYCCNLTAGTVVFNGNGLQTSSGFKPIGLTLENTSEDGVVFTSSLVVYGMFNHNGNKFTLYNNGKGSYFIDSDGDGINDHLDPEPTLGPYTVPVVSVDNYVVTISAAIHIKDIRYALGEYTTPSEIKAAEGNVAISNALVQKYTVTGRFVYEMPKGGYYTVWVRMQDGTNYILPLDVTHFTPTVTTYGVKVTLNNLYDVKDFYIAKGEYNTYREIKDNGYIVSVTDAKIGNKHNYTYTVYEPGVHTILIRYNDGSQAIFHETLTVDEPVFTANGLQVTISNLPDVKVIRTAYGKWSTIKELKATDTIRNFSDKTAIKGKDPYTIQYREEGTVTVIVEYNNGYQRVFHYEVTKKTPTFTQQGNVVTFGELDGLVTLRYAKGEYTTVSQIKNAAGSKALKPANIADGRIEVDLDPGTYTFCVQYDDESYNYYTVSV